MTHLLALTRVHTEIDARVAAIRAGQAEWLCGKGCGGCCQRLAAVPQLTATEWQLLREGLLMLPPARLDEIRQHIAALATHSPRPVVCPLLDRLTQACPVYAQRPVACRTYGFYAQRDLGLYCQEIQAQESAGMLSEVVWGNHDQIDRALAGLGETRALTDWFDL